MLVQKEACIFSHRMEGQYRSGIQLFCQGAPSISLSGRNRLVFRTSEDRFGEMNQDLNLF